MNKDIEKLLRDRYFLKDEKSWENLASRVSSIYPYIYDDILNMNFIPSSPTLMNCNTKGERVGTLSSCFPMGIEDSIDDIGKAVHECMLVTKAGGGVGYDFSELRSSEEVVKGIGNRLSSGPLPFIKIFNEVLDGVSQAGARRGAGISLISIFHPDILDFIKAKDDITKFTRFNFSIKIPDSFYDILKKDPSSKHKVQYKNGEFKELDITVQELWNLIVERAWKTGEPGIFNEDTARNRCTVTNLSNKVITNPCLPKYVELLTPTGIKLLEDIMIGDIIWSTEGWTTIINKESKGIKDVYEYETLHEYVLYCTEDHKVIFNGNKIKAKDTKFFDCFFTTYFVGKDKYNFDKKTIPDFKMIGEYKETCEVFDLTVDNKSHTFWCNGFNICNCGEYTNIPYTSCSLGSINLLNMLDNNNNFDWNKFENLIVKATRYINNTLDINLFPIPEIKETTLKVRAIGLGFMGLAHLLYKMNLPYSSKKAQKLIEDIILYMTLRSMKESIQIAKEENKVYPVYDKDLFLTANDRLFRRKRVKNIDIADLLKDLSIYGTINSANTSIAPTGTLSIIANTSSGVEPVFALTYTRKIEKMDKQYENMYITDPIFEEYLNQNFDDKYKEKILKEVSNNNGSCQKCKDIPEDMKNVFVVASDLTPSEHLNVLSIVNKGVSLSVSKTINLPKSATKEDISEVYQEAHNLGIIGITVYRDGSREGILVHKNSNNNIMERSAPKRPKSLPCHVYKIKVHGEDWIVFIGIYTDKETLESYPYEIFSGKIGLVDLPSNITEGCTVKTKSCTYQFEHNGEVLIKDIKQLFDSRVQEALTRLISLHLRTGTPLEFVIEQLKKSHGTIADFNISILRALKRYMKNKVSKSLCPECQSPIIFKEGCENCSKCTWSKCL